MGSSPQNKIKTERIKIYYTRPQAVACGFFVLSEKVGFIIQAISLKIEKNSEITH
jgi:hypothetical protein|nr:MAG TPA: hypothetical protein [Bacteriophage sp.]